MKVRELVEHLLKLDQELEVYTAIDAEGNGYNSVYFEPSVSYAANINGRSREIEVFNDLEEAEDGGYDEDDLTQIVII